MVRFPFLKALSPLAVIVVVIILFSLVFTILKTNETFPSYSLKKYMPTFSCPEKKSHEIQFGRGNTFLNVFI